MTVLEQEKEAGVGREPREAGGVSRRIAGPLHQVAGRARVLSFLLATFQVMVLTLCPWLVIVLVLGGIREIAIPAAFVLAGVAWVVLLGGTFFFYRPALRGTDLTAAARLVDRALPETDERISSALELSQEEDTRFQGSAELIAVLVRQAEHAAESLDPNAIISGKRVFHWFLGTIPLLLVWFVLFVVMTPTLTLGMERVFEPWRAAAALPTAALEVQPGNVTVAQGDPVTIRLTVTPLGVTAADAEKPVKSATITRRYAAGNTNEDVTVDMKATGNHTFEDYTPAVQQTFSYRVASLGAQSPTYTVTVDPRPTVSGIQIDYVYPAYTKRAAHSDMSRDGTVDALVGTQVKLTIETSQPVKSARIVITDNAPDPGALILQPVDRTDTKFTTDFVVRKTTDYRIELINEHDLESKDPQAHQIIARIDAPPTIAITAPTEPILKVRPEDSVTVRFSAGDDLAVTKIEAIAQADNQAPITFLLPALPPNTTSFDGTWTLSPRDVVGTTGAVAGIPRPKRITYQLRATDNRDPDPQVGVSAKQTLELDEKVAPLADREDTQAARTLGEAVKQSASDLEDAKSKLDKLRQAAAARPLTEEEKQQAADARSEINRAGQKLQNAAEKTGDSSLADAAARAKEIANQPIRQAEENTAAGQLASDQPEARNKNFDSAGQNLTDAHQKLDQLARDIDAKAKDQPMARELQRIAEEQKKLAEEMASHPNDPALLAKQRKLQQDLDNVIKEHPELQRPGEEAAKGDTHDVQRKLDDLAKTQQQFNEQAKAQSDATVAQDKLNDLAKQQEQLNQQIKEFSSRNPGERAPAPAQLDSIPRDLRNRNLPGATQGQSATANQLDQAAQQLENEQRRENSGEAGPKDASDLQSEASRLQKQIEEAQRSHNPPTRPSDPANQQANKLADEVKRVAQQQAARSPAQRAAAKQASDEADAAKRDATQGDAVSAQQHLANAANRLAAASGENSPPANQGSNGQSAAKAAEEARQLAQQQRNIADQTSQTNRSLETAASARGNAEQSAQEQQKLADKMEEAAKSARELQQKTQGSAPDLSERAGQAARQLESAAQSQRSAAQATREGNTSQAQSQQSQAARAMDSAKKSLGQSPGEESVNEQSGPSSGGQGNPQSGGQSARGGQSASGQPQQSGGPASPPTSPIGQMGQSGSSASGQGGASSAARAVQAARNAQSEAASGNPAAAQHAAEQLSQASQQLLNGPAASSGSPSGSPNGPQNPASGSKGNNAPTASGNGQPTSPQNPASVNGPGGGSAGQPNGRAGSGATGMQPEKNAAAHSMPKAVEDVGIAPSDWAKLPPNMQEQLLNSAQQSGPPAYRDMIKNYYSRIAQLEQQPQGGK